jgi:hypothetical protein
VLGQCRDRRGIAAGVGDTGREHGVADLGPRFGEVWHRVGGEVAVPVLTVWVRGVPEVQNNGELYVLGRG